MKVKKKISLKKIIRNAKKNYETSSSFYHFLLLINFSTNESLQHHLKRNKNFETSSAQSFESPYLTYNKQ